MEQEIKDAISELEQKLRDKECCNVSASTVINSHAVLDDFVNMTYRISPKAEVAHFYASGKLSDCLLQAHRHIDALPSKADRDRAEFYKLVARAAEFGRSVDMDESLINPLSEMAKKLASNALSAPVPMRDPLDDEIPF